MSRLPLATLPAFRAVAELENLRAAADRLHLTHSAVSQQIRVLETQLGFAVFDRGGRRIKLNAAGRVLLHSVQSALTQLDDGVHAAAQAACGLEQRLRVSVLPSFAQRWLLPRMHRWRDRHPQLALEIDASQQPVDLQREGFHVALRQGAGPWANLMSERLFEGSMPLIVVGCAIDARRLLGEPAEALLSEPLLGDAEVWRAWFAAAGVRANVTPVAVFNDSGMMLQAAEQGLGLALTRELLAADALHAGRLLRLSPVSVEYEVGHTYHFVYPPNLQTWPPLMAFRTWIRDELALSQQRLEANTPAATPR